jgi:competence protein ComEC
MPALPFALVAFAVGTVLLQWQPSLPAAREWMAAAASLGLCSVWVRNCLKPAIVTANIVSVLAVAAAGAFGFGYAAWRAEVRLA